MHARITPFKMKSGKAAEAAAMVDGLRDQIMGMPGMQHFTCSMNADGRGYIVAVVESAEISNANMPLVKEIWANFLDHLESPPNAEGFDVIADWGR